MDSRSRLNQSGIGVSSSSTIASSSPSSKNGSVILRLSVLKVGVDPWLPFADVARLFANVAQLPVVVGVWSDNWAGGTIGATNDF